MREHILFGAVDSDTLITGCGKKPELHTGCTVDGKRVRDDYYTLGTGCAVPEAVFTEILKEHPGWLCRTCVAALRKVYRHRGDKFPNVKAAV